MKEIIYLDTDFIHSYLSQIHGGLPGESSNERSQEISDQIQSSTESTNVLGASIDVSTGKITIPVFLETPQGKVNVHLDVSKTSSESSSTIQTDAGREIISKRLHDNALVEMEEHLIEEGLLNKIDNNDIVGKYVKLTTSFRIIDFHYLRKIIQKDKLVKFMFNDRDKELKDLASVINEMPNGKDKNLKQAQLKQTRKSFDEMKNTTKDEFAFVEEAIDYLNDFLPTQAFLLAGSAILPLKSDCLRERSELLSFKYMDSDEDIQVTILGKVTSKLESAEMPDINTDNLYDFPKIVHVLLNALGLLEEGDAVISPIAIYFE